MASSIDPRSPCSVRRVQRLRGEAVGRRGRQNSLRRRPGRDETCCVRRLLARGPSETKRANPNWAKSSHICISRQSPLLCPCTYISASTPQERFRRHDGTRASSCTIAAQSLASTAVVSKDQWDWGFCSALYTPLRHSRMKNLDASIYASRPPDSVRITFAAATCPCGSVSPQSRNVLGPWLQETGCFPAPPQMKRNRRPRPVIRSRPRARDGEMEDPAILFNASNNIRFNSSHRVFSTTPPRPFNVPRDSCSSSTGLLHACLRGFQRGHGRRLDHKARPHSQRPVPPWTLENKPRLVVCKRSSPITNPPTFQRPTSPVTRLCCQWNVWGKSAAVF